MFVRAIYASDPLKSAGRKVKETDSPSRSAYQRDRDRVIHATAFRRLKHKTQVFVYHEGDHYRTRLTHSIEVAQIARSIARALGLDEDLAEACALAHDLGHPPFGHAGEEALSECMKDYGGFDHNEQTFRILTELEKRYAEFDGLNLTWESLEGIVKHNGPLLGPYVSAKYLATDISKAMDLYSDHSDFKLNQFASAEAQVAALADDVAYCNHDLDDGIRAQMFDLKDLKDFPVVGEAIRECEAKWPNLEIQRLTHETIRRLIDFMVTDILQESRKRLENIKHPDEVRQASYPAIAFSPNISAAILKLKSFLFEQMYRHYKVNRMSFRAKRVLHDLFDIHLARPDCLPSEWQKGIKVGDGDSKIARHICDYLAGMTDKYALETHRMLLGNS